MPCSDCKHWRTSKAHRNNGVCIVLTAEYRQEPNGQALKATGKTRIRQKKRRDLIEIMTTWTPAEQLTTLSNITYTAPTFFCALYDRDKRRKQPKSLPVVRIPENTVPRALQIILEDEED